MADGSVVSPETLDGTDADLTPGRVKLGHVEVSRFIIGGNPFSGFSHQTRERDREMLDWYTMERVKEALRTAQAAGVTAHLGRADNFIIRVLREHWNEGGSLLWIAQQCPYVGTLRHGISNAAWGHASCCFLHGGEMDMRVAKGDTADVCDAIKMIKDSGMAAGVAGHRTETIQWAADNLELDFFMTSYYNPSDRRNRPDRDYDVEEYYGDEDRDAMCALIQDLPAPAIHYKVLAAGRHDPAAAFAYVADAYRPGDAVCVGIHTGDNMRMVQDDVNLLERALCARGK